MALPFFVGVWKHKVPRTARYMKYFLAAFLVGVAPFLAAVVKEGYGQHIGAMSMINGWVSIGQRLASGASYVTSLFWGSLVGDSSYVASRGGMLNPLLGAAFFLGLLQMVRHRNQAWVKWVGGAFLIALAPGLVCMNIEMFRVIQVMPYLLLITGWGLWVLLSELSPGRRLPILILIGLASVTLDASGIVKTYVEPFQSSQAEAASDFPMEDIRAYRILKETSQRMGPGLIFTQFDPVSDNLSLFVTTYGFNAAANPRLRPSDAHWAAVVANLHYYPFLSQAFPEALWYWIHEGRNKGQEAVLGLLPVTDTTRPILGRWVEAHRYFRRLTWEFNSVSEDKTYAEAQRVFTDIPRVIGEDRFLESCYWETRAEFDYTFNYQAHYEDMVAALRQAITGGYPAAHLYYKLGSLLMRKRAFGPAHGAFEAALRQEPDNQQVLDALNFLKRME